MTRIAVIVGSTRPARRTRVAADWVYEVAARHLAGQATVELVDLADFDLPLLDEPVAAIFGDYRNPHTVRWAATVDSFDLRVRDGLVLVPLVSAIVAFGVYPQQALEDSAPSAERVAAIAGGGSGGEAIALEATP